MRFFEDKPQKTSNFEVRMRSKILRFLATLVKRLQKYQRSKLVVDKKLPTQPDLRLMRPGPG